MGFKWRTSLSLTPSHKVKSALRASPPQRGMLSTRRGHILMLQPPNLLPGSGVSHAVLTCTGMASGDRDALVPMPRRASADAQGNAPSPGGGNVEERGEGIESPGFSLFLGPDLPSPSPFPPTTAAVAIVAITFSPGGQEDQGCLPLAPSLTPSLLHRIPHPN